MSAKPAPSAKGTKGAPVLNPIEKTGTEVDDNVRQDSGKPTDEKAVSQEELKKTEEKARDHTKDEPGS